MLTILTICAITSCIISCTSLIIGLYSTIKVLSLEKSTHSVQLVPMEMQPEQNWATKEDVLEDINKVSKEDNEEFFGL